MTSRSIFFLPEALRGRFRALPEECSSLTLPSAGGLFRSRDRGANWELIRPLWDNPKRQKWMGGGTGVGLDLRPH